MVMLKKISLLFLFLTSSFLIAQETPVHFKQSFKKISDCEYDLQFTAAIDEPWHIYSLSPVKDGPNPTVFTFTPNLRTMSWLVKKQKVNQLKNLIRYLK
jgi:hypothetical protein